MQIASWMSMVTQLNMVVLFQFDGKFLNCAGKIKMIENTITQE